MSFEDEDYEQPMDAQGTNASTVVQQLMENQETQNLLFAAGLDALKFKLSVHRIEKIQSDSHRGIISTIYVEGATPEGELVKCILYSSFEPLEISEDVHGEIQAALRGMIEDGGAAKFLTAEARRREQLKNENAHKMHPTILDLITLPKERYILVPENEDDPLYALEKRGIDTTRITVNKNIIIPKKSKCKSERMWKRAIKSSQRTLNYVCKNFDIIAIQIIEHEDHWTISTMDKLPPSMPTHEWRHERRIERNRKGSLKDILHAVKGVNNTIDFSVQESCAHDMKNYDSFLIPCNESGNIVNDDESVLGEIHHRITSTAGKFSRITIRIKNAKINETSFVVYIDVPKEKHSSSIPESEHDWIPDDDGQSHFDSDVLDLAAAKGDPKEKGFEEKLNENKMEAAKYFAQQFAKKLQMELQLSSHFEEDDFIWITVTTEQPSAEEYLLASASVDGSCKVTVNEDYDAITWEDRVIDKDSVEECIRKMLIYYVPGERFAVYCPVVDIEESKNEGTCSIRVMFYAEKPTTNKDR